MREPRELQFGKGRGVRIERCSSTESRIINHKLLPHKNYALSGKGEQAKNKDIIGRDNMRIGRDDMTT